MKLRRKEFKRAVILEAVLSLAGLILLPLALSLFCQLAGSLFWRLKLKYYYVEGRARVENVEVIPREGDYTLRVTHRLENGAEHHETSEFTEEEDPSTPTAAKAEVLRARYQVGQLYPCWYRPGTSDANNVLLYNGLDLWWPVRAVWVPVVIGAAGWLSCRWSWRRWKTRGWTKDEKPE